MIYHSFDVEGTTRRNNRRKTGKVQTPYTFIPDGWLESIINEPSDDRKSRLHE